MESIIKVPRYVSSLLLRHRRVHWGLPADANEIEMRTEGQCHFEEIRFLEAHRSGATSGVKLSC